MDYEKTATRLFLSLITPYGHNAQMRERDIKLIAQSLMAASANGRLRIEPVGFAVHSTRDPVGSVHLDHVLAIAAQFAGQRRAERSRALDPDRGDNAMAAHP